MNFDIKQKLGPLPVWLWGLIVAGVGLALVYVFQRFGGTEAGSDALATSTIDGQVGYQTSGLSGAGSAIEDVADTKSNLQWINDAARNIANRLGKSPSQVTAALTKWLNGMDLTYEESQIVDATINAYGSPPEGTSGISPVANPTDATKTITGYVGVVDSPAVRAIYSDGSVRTLSASEYSSLGSPRFAFVASNGSPIVRYVKRSGSVAIYAVAQDGKRYLLSAAEYKRAGSPSTTTEVFS